MITRIVKMVFHPEHTGLFLDLFGKHALNMQEVAGCLSLQLQQDANDPRIFFTLSAWQDPQSLEAYRQSELFRKIWTLVKPLFSERAQAWTTHTIYDGKN